MNQLVRSVHLKLERASAQTIKLDNEAQRWIAANHIRAKCELLKDRLGFRLVQEEFAEPPPFEQWGLLLGECAHNMRSALDNLAYALARLHKDPPMSPGQISFPIFTDRKRFEESGRKNLKALPKKAADLIEQLQPFQRNVTSGTGLPESDALNLLQQINNFDKHRVPAFVLLAPTRMEHSFSVAFVSEEQAAKEAPPDTMIWGGPLAPGAVLIEQRTRSPVAKVEGSYQGAAVLQIQIAERNLPLEQVISVCRYVHLVCSQFNPFFDLP